MKKASTFYVLAATQGVTPAPRTLRPFLVVCPVVALGAITLLRSLNAGDVPYPGRVILPTTGPTPAQPAPSLRFVAYRCELTAEGLRATFRGGGHHQLAWTDGAALVVRQLPPGPPGQSQMLLDIVPRGAKAATPIRLLSSTHVNYEALAEGAHASRVENVRRLAARIRSANSSVSIDAETGAFLKGGPAPRIADARAFAEYDARYG